EGEGIVRFFPRPPRDVRCGDRRAWRFERRADHRRSTLTVQDETGQTLTGEEVVPREVLKIRARRHKKRAEILLAQLCRCACPPVREAHSFARHPFCIRG